MCTIDDKNSLHLSQDYEYQPLLVDGVRIETVLMVLKESLSSVVHVNNYGFINKKNKFDNYLKLYFLLTAQVCWQRKWPSLLGWLLEVVG